MRRLVPCLALAVAALALPSSAQTVDEVIAKNVAARGGLDKIRAVQSLRMTGTMSMGPGMDAPMVLELARGNRMRMEFTVQGKQGIQTFDGTSGWVLMQFMGQTEAEAMPAEAIKDVVEQTDLDGPLVDYQKKGHKVELVGKDQAPGADAYHLRVTLKSGVVRDIWVDAASGLEVRGEGRREMGGRTMEAETVLGDYRAVDGMQFPHRIEGGPKGTPQKQTIAITKIEVNPTLDAARFGKPTPAPAPTDKPI
jgi:outer membrane lipoprotein-sorting protein